MTSSSGNTDLVETTDNTLTIPTLASGSYSSPSDFPANHWGYKKDSGSYIPFAINTTILESDTYANDDTTTLSFATKIDYLQASGTYKTTLVFTTTANPLVYYIQNLNPTLCTTTPMTVVDKRDDQEYIIQRLADGNCWMMTNLNLGAIAIADDLTSANTNLSTTIIASDFNAWQKSRGSQSFTTPELFPIDGTDSASQTPYGTLYNYCAASAGTYCMTSSTASDGDAKYDICPAGWRLPTGGPSGEFQNLYNQPEYNTYAKMQAPISSGGFAFARAGWVGSGAVANKGTYGVIWSSTRYNGGFMYLIFNSGSSIDPTFYNHWRWWGTSIRCVLK